MNSASVRLAEQLNNKGQWLSHHVAARLLRAFPELTRSLRLEENYSPTTRLSQVSVERLNELVRSMLLFETPSLADQEIRWAHGILPRRGVTYEHQSAMVRWFFEEVRHLPLDEDQLTLTRELEQYLLGQVRQVYQAA